MVRTEETGIPGSKIVDIEDSYKYLRTQKANGNHEESSRKAESTKYLQLVVEVLRSQLNIKNKFLEIHTYAMLIVRCAASWPNEEKPLTSRRESS